MNKCIKQKKNNNKGFTMVELIVVLVLMLILLSIAIFGGLAWQDWSRFQHEDSVAEEIFFAAQNQLIEYDSSGAMERKFVTPLKSSANYNSYVIASSDKNGTVTGEEALNMITDSDGTKCEWGKIWANSSIVADAAEINVNLDTVERTIITLRAARGDFDKYQQYKAATTQAERNAIGLDDGTVLLFDLVATYISDTSVLNGAIVIELSPEAGQVLSVCYSDLADSFVYGDTSGGSISVLDRTLTTREKNMIGYYSVGQLTEKIRGRNVDESDVRLEIRNGNVLEMIVYNLDAGSEGFKDDDEFEFTIYNGENTNDISVIEGLSLRYGDIKNINTLEQANISPIWTAVTLKGGKYAGQELKFRFPAWVDGENIHIVLDAADIQAGTSVYKTDSELNGQTYNDANKAFRNTYSFFRFGLTDVNYIYASVEVKKEGSGADVIPVYSVRKLAGIEYVDHKELADEEGGFCGECTAFKSLSADENDSNKNIYEIDNGRHFYNMRYVTEKKADGSKNNVFKLVNDIDWKVFTGIEGTDGKNYFLDSYPDQTMSVDDKAEMGPVGIDYEGYIIANGETKSEGIVSYDTGAFDFPGFRCLGKGDVFTQNVAYGKTGDNGETSFTISNLNISFTANVIYGVYDNVIGDAKVACMNGNFSELLGLSNSGAADSSGSKYARGGALPLGLFCENLGTISNITLNKHVVKGIETFSQNGTRGSGVTPDQVVCTNMVGGFAGNNLGTIEKLTLLDFESNDSAENAEADLAGITKISGRTDVGGIIGRESFVVSTNASTEIGIKDMKNYGKVTGMENIGGIVGRAYRMPDSFDSNRAKNYHDGYFITDNKKSMTGVDVGRVTKITIEDCSNRGAVSGDIAFAGDSNNNSYKCAFIGGIAGITIDGAVINGNTEFNIKVKNCDSFSMEKDVTSRIVSANDTSALRNSFKALDRDYYVGGLVGYARLTAFENINTDLPSELKDDGAAKSYVMGAGYVGGIVGCADYTRFDKSSNASEGSYAATNYNNVIGKAGVGGIAGGFGIGGEKTSFSFRNPSSNSGSVVSGYEDINYVAGKDLLNSGVVLSLKSNKDINFNFSEYAYKTDITGACGGITGVAASPIEDCDNIQPSGVKKLMIKLISGSDQVDGFYGDSYGSTQLSSLFDSTKFGGNAVGGIMGYAVDGVVLNENSGTDSKVDAIVFGQDKVGGFVGFNTADAGGLRDMYPAKGSGSKGMLVLGRDEVGGVIGELRNEIWNNRPIDTTYTVKGCFGVGGIVGANSNEGETNYARFTVKLDSGKVKINGIGYVGGYLGISDKRNEYDMSCSIQLADMDVTGRYFVGGLYGAVVSDGKQKLSEVNVNNNDSSDRNQVKVDSTVNVNADAYAGGVVGLYSIHSDLYKGFMSVDGDGDSNRTLPHSIYASHTDTFTGIANADISGTDLFVKGNGSVTVSLDENPDLQATVEAKIFAGGLFGYVPEGTNVVVDGYTNRSSIHTSGSVKGVYESYSGDTKYSYLGGVIGRVPKNMTLLSCYNSVSGMDVSGDNPKYYYSSDASFMGGLTEVNAGLITGRVEGDNVVLLENTTSYVYDDFEGGIGAFAGVNGTKVTDITEASNDKYGVIKFASNSVGVQIVGKTSAGIAAASGGDSMIMECINYADIGKDVTTTENPDAFEAGTKSAGIVAVSVVNENSDVVIGRCVNTGDIFGQDTAGIAVDTSGRGNIEFCRNYGIVHNAESAITKTNALKLYGNLEASGKNEGTEGNKNPIGPVVGKEKTDLVRNFYISGTADKITEEGEEPGGSIIDNPDAFGDYTGVKEGKWNQHLLTTIFGWDPWSKVNNLRQGYDDSNIKAADYPWVKEYFENPNIFNSDNNKFYKFFEGAFCAFIVNHNMVNENYNDYIRQKSFYERFLPYAKQIIDINTIPAADDHAIEELVEQIIAENDLAGENDETPWYDLSRYETYTSYKYDGSNSLGTVFGYDAKRILNVIVANGSYITDSKYDWIRDFYRARYGNGQLAADSLSTDPMYIEIWKGLFSEYLYNNPDDINVIIPDPQGEAFDRFLAYAKSVIGDDYTAGQGNDPGDDPGNDPGENPVVVSYDTHWPCQLYVNKFVLEVDTYRLAFKKGNNYYKTGIEGLLVNPGTVHGKDLYDALDSKYMEFIESADYTDSKYVPDYTY